MAGSREKRQRRGSFFTVYRTVCKISELVEGLGRTFYVADKAIAVFLVNGVYYAIDDTCPHMGASLAGGFVENGTVTCPWHFWRFRLSDGAWADNPKLRTGCFPVRVTGDELQVELPNLSAETSVEVPQ